MTAWINLQDHEPGQALLHRALYATPPDPQSYVFYLCPQRRQTEGERGFDALLSSRREHGSRGQ